MTPPPAVEERIRAHVDSILRVAHVPSKERADVAEELYGHLVERWTESTARGASDEAAADDAINGFGTAHGIGRDLTRAYRGQFWASTIGTLIPARSAAPGVTSIGRGALAWSVGMLGVMTATGALDQLTALTPIRAIVVGVAWAAAACILLITYVAVLRGQRWGLHLAIGITAATAAHGAISLWIDPSTSPLQGLLSAAALAVAWLDRRKVAEVTPSVRPQPRLLVGAMAGVLIAGFASGPLMAAIEDPTQASADDLDLVVQVRCDQVVEPLLDDMLVLRWTVDVLWEWSHVSVLPRGLQEWHDHSDAIVLRHPGDDWVLMATRPPHEAVTTGRTIGWQGGGEPSAGAIPPDLLPAVVEFGIHTSDTHPDVRYQAAWIMHSQTWTEEWPEEAEAWYFHGDTWRLVAKAGCDESGEGAAPPRP